MIGENIFKSVNKENITGLLDHLSHILCYLLDFFLAVQDSSIGDIDSQSLIKSVRLLISASPEHYRLLRDF